MSYVPCLRVSGWRIAAEQQLSALRPAQRRGRCGDMDRLREAAQSIYQQCLSEKVTRSNTVSEKIAILIGALIVERYSERWSFARQVISRKHVVGVRAIKTDVIFASWCLVILCSLERSFAR